jgi:hypothetical protein
MNGKAGHNGVLSCKRPQAEQFCEEIPLLLLVLLKRIQRISVLGRIGMGESPLRYSLRLPVLQKLP